MIQNGELSRAATHTAHIATHSSYTHSSNTHSSRLHAAALVRTGVAPAVNQPSTDPTGRVYTPAQVLFYIIYIAL